MALPSQTARAADRRTNMFRRRRHRSLKALVAVVLLIIPAWIAYAIFLSPGGDDGARAGNVLASTDSRQESSSNQLTWPGADSETPDDEESVSQQNDPRENRPQQPRRAEGQSARGDDPSAREQPSQRSAPEDTGSSAVETQPSPSPRDRQAEASQPAPPERSRDSLRPGQRKLLDGLSIIHDDAILARRLLTEAYLSGDLNDDDRQRIRSELTTLNEEILFGEIIVPNDPFTQSYRVEGGDNLTKIVKKRSLLVEPAFLIRVNGMTSDRIRLGQTLKLVTGPFHLLIDKSHYRADLFLGDGSDRVYVRSFDVGLGELNSTPIGAFRVRPNSKVVDPGWTNPRTGKHYKRDDPQNPIGERWIGLLGIDESTKTLDAYGIHGTIDPDSIGEQRSMGCIRLRDTEIELVYELLMENASVIQIVP